MPESSVISFADTGTQGSVDAPNTKAAIEDAWQTAKMKFQKAWPRKGRHLLFVVHDENIAIDDEVADNLIAEVNLLGKHQPVDVILHTHGGGATPTDRIAHSLVGRKNTAAFVPFYAWSGGTEIALATQKIFLGKGATLGPMDIQMNGIPARDFIRLAEELGENADPGLRLLAMQASRALRDETKRVCALINRRHKGWFGLRGCALAQKLTEGDMYHGEPIRYKKARRLGVKAERRVPDMLYPFISTRREQLKALRQLDAQITFVQVHAAEKDPVSTISSNALSYRERYW